MIREAPGTAPEAPVAEEEYWLRVETAQYKRVPSILGFDAADEEESSAESDTHCDACGATVAAEETFCANCGIPLRGELMSEEPIRSNGIDTVLLDAGGVLLDLDYSYLRRLVEARHGAAAESDLARWEAEARVEIHHQVEKGGSVAEAWRDYFHVILGRAGVPADDQSELIDSLWEAHQRFGLWTVAIPGAVDTVAELKRLGYKVGVVSNAEGRVEQDLEAAGFRGMFETVVDSHVVGVAKPDPGIFAIVLERMGAAAAKAVFLGDVPAVDVVGARAAGIRPVLLDRHGLYPEVDVPRLARIEEFPACLEELEALRGL